MADVRSLQNNNRRELLTLVAQATLVILGILLLAAALYFMWHVLILLFIGLVLAASMRPVVMAARQRGVPKVLTILLIYLAIIGVLVAAAMLVIPILTNEIGSLIASAPQRYAEIHASIATSDNVLLRQLAGSLPDPAALANGQLSINGTNARAAEAAGTVLAEAAGLGTATVTLIVDMISTLVLALYWVVDQPRFERLWLSLLPTAERSRYLAIWREIEAKMGAYVRGIGIQCLSIALMVGVGYFVLGIKYPLGLAVLAGICEAIPLIGPFLGAIPALAVAAGMGPEKVLYVAIFTLIVQEIEANVLVPKVMERAVGVSPLVTLLAMLGFGSVMGLLGVLLAIPFAAVIQVLLDYFVINKDVVVEDELAAAPLGSLRDQVHQLRVQLRERYRSNEELLDPEKNDQLDQHLERIVEQVDDVVAQAADAVDPTTPPVAPEDVKQLSQELAHVKPLLEEARGTVVNEADHDQGDQEVDQLIASVGTVLDEAHQAVIDAATETNGPQEVAEAIKAADPPPITADHR